MTAEISQAQAQALAGFLAALRPGWDAPGIVAALCKARHRADVAEVAIAAIRAAVDPSNRTPAVIALDGAHWREPQPATVRHEPLQPPRPAEQCPQHPGRHRDSCGLCRVEHYGPTVEPLDGDVAAVRRALRQPMPAAAEGASR